MILFKKAMKEEKSRRESAIVDNMETQTDTQTSTSQLWKTWTLIYILISYWSVRRISRKTVEQLNC
jgi:hypothetical protein